MRTQIQSVWVMHSESVLTQNFLFSNSEGKWRCKSRCGRARRRPWLRARRRPWRLCGGGGRDPAAREPRQEAAMAAREEEAMADLRRRASRGGRRPWRSTGSRNPFAGGRDPFARTSSGGPLLPSPATRRCCYHPLPQLRCGDLDAVVVLFRWARCLGGDAEGRREDAFLRRAPARTQNASLICLVRWRAILVPKCTVRDVFWVWVAGCVRRWRQPKAC